MGSDPPVDSITISAQKTPVEMCTDAIFETAMLSSLLPKNRPFTRDTRCGLITSLVGKRKFPCVHRDAVNVSAGDESIALSADVVKERLDDSMAVTDQSYTHSSAPFFQTQM